jgi:protein SCO1
MRCVILLVILIGAVIGAACSTNVRNDVRRYQLTGVVVSRDASSSRVRVAHEAISGLMPAMSMEFEVRGGEESIREGDRIMATLVLNDARSWLEDLKVTARSGAAVTSPATARAAPGAVVPDLPLVDQNGAPFTLRDGLGRVRIITFIYTRCPLRDFCPLMFKNLEAVRRRANKEGPGSQLALLGVTLDPAFDTPPVLRAYGESMLTGSNRFDQWTLATGTPAQIENVARFFGVGYRAENGLVTHTLATAVIGHDGRVMRVFESNSWRPDEVYDVVRRGIEQPVR